MLSVELIKEWLDGLPNDTLVGIDDGGLMLCTEKRDGYLEVGGMPEEDLTPPTPLDSMIPATDSQYVMANAAHWLRDRGISATFEYPGYIAVECSGERGNANFGNANGPYEGTWDDGTSVEGFEQPITAGSVHLADAIETWCRKENQQQ